MYNRKHQTKILNSLPFLTLIAILLASGSAYSDSTEVWVDSQYNSSTPGWNLTHFATIQSAINSVANKGTVTVGAGTYLENILIEKSIFLIGESEHTALIDGQGKGYTIEIRSGDVEISDLKLTNAGPFENWAVIATGPSNLTVNNNYFLDKGIFIGANNCTVTNNRIEGQGSIFISTWNNLVKNNYLDVLYPGSIWVMGKVSNNIISHNTIIGDENDASCTGIRSIMSHNNLYSNNILKNFRVHILLSCSNGNILNNNIISGNRGWPDEIGGGIVLYRSSNNSVLSNNISSVIDGGIMLWGGSNENQIQANIVNDSERGIELYINSERNNIINNAISNCEVGLRLFSSSNNKINSNNLENNIAQGYDDGTNSWSDNGRGNYWSNYIGNDLNDDGVGDTPHSIPKDTNDPAPLISPANIVPPNLPDIVLLPYDIKNLPATIINSDVVWENSTDDITNRFIINNGGRLTIDRMNLNIKCDQDFTFIIVNSGGTLKIINSSLKSQGAGILVNRGANLHIENSFFSQLGVWDGDGAVQVSCDGAIIKNNIFDGGYAAVLINDGASNIEFVGNTIRNVRLGLFFCCELSQNNKVENNIFENIVEHAICDFGGIGKSHIIGNQFKNVWGETMKLPDFGHENIIQNNISENCPPYIEPLNQTTGGTDSGGGGGGGCFITTSRY